MPENCAATQRDLVNLERWTNSCHMKFSGKREVLHLEITNLGSSTGDGTTSWKTEKDLCVLVDTKLNKSQQYVLAARKISSILRFFGPRVPLL